MSDDTRKQELLRDMARLLLEVQPGGEFAPCKDMQEWEQLVESRTPEQQELLRELAHFADLWRYLGERKQNLGREIVNAIRRVHTLPMPARITEIRSINRELMLRIGDAGESTQFRQ